MEGKRNSSSGSESGRRSSSAAAAIDHQSKQYLPIEVIHNILTRLPVRSLLCFKSVSKLWFRAISEPKFAEEHLFLQSANLNPNELLDRQRILFFPDNNYVFKFPSLDLELITTHKDHSNYFKVGARGALTSFPLQEPKKLCGSCNGLLLFRLLQPCHTFVIWNPSTNACADFFYPCNDSQLDGNHADHGNVLTVAGLCYDSSLDDYKVVFTITSDGPVFTAVVYSLKSSSWKDIGEVPYCNSSKGNTNSVIVNGALHWFVAIYDDDDRRAIVYFDLLDEKFKELPLSKCLQERLDGYNSSESKHQLALHMGRLCLFYTDRYHPKIKSEFEVWIMNEYGVGESWAKSFTIPIEHPGILEICWPNQFCFIKEDQILCVGRYAKAVLYSLKENKWEVISALKGCGPYIMITYVASLISPSFGNTKECMEGQNSQVLAVLPTAD